MSYQPIESYGIIGDLRTVALVGMNGSIDWYCTPNFDSPAVFGALLDDRIGGRFQIRPTDGDVNAKQLYLPDSNVLLTRFMGPDGVAELTDFMPIAPAGQEEQHDLIRRVTVVRGSMRFELVCQPAFDFARAPHTVEIGDDGAVFRSRTLALGLSASVPLQETPRGTVHARFALDEGQSASFVLRNQPPDVSRLAPLGEAECEGLFRATLDFWHRWLRRSRYAGRWREMVHRSALVLKLLTFEPTGALVAAPTTSLPEVIGGVRNWDYRYTWIRDASFTLYALLRIGFTEEAGRFMGWIEARMRELEPDGSLQVMYAVDGRHDLTEITLDHLEGYRGSRPVRVGNAAFAQQQLDIHGALMDSVYLYNKHGAPISYDLWVNLRRLLAWLEKHWQEPDDGIWEVRGGRRHFVHSRVMSWVAFERAMRIARQRGLPADIGRWREVRDAIYEEVVEKGWNPTLRSFVQAYGSDRLDAATLLFPLVKFLGPGDPRMLATLDAVRRTLVSDSLVYRYRLEGEAVDGLPGEEGSFSLCTFWLVECLTRAGLLEDARLIFEKMLTHANHLGLYAEQIGRSGEALGNFPQAFTHLALISAAFNLDRALDYAARG